MALDQWSQFVKDHRFYKGPCRVSKSIRFHSGLILSVQASTMHCCSPRENDPLHGWLSFEVFASEDMMITFHDQRTLGVKDPEEMDLQDPIGWVTIAALDAVAENNGGIAGCEEYEEDTL